MSECENHVVDLVHRSQALVTHYTASTPDEALQKRLGLHALFHIDRSPELGLQVCQLRTFAAVVGGVLFDIVKSCLLKRRAHSRINRNWWQLVADVADEDEFVVWVAVDQYIFALV